MSEEPAPYPGLRPFMTEEWPYFFGRARHASALYRQLDRGRFLAVIGGSGSGTPRRWAGANPPLFWLSIPPDDAQSAIWIAIIAENTQMPIATAMIVIESSSG